MKYRIDENHVEPFEIDDVEIEHHTGERDQTTANESDTREWLVKRAFLVFAAVVAAGLYLVLKNDDFTNLESLFDFVLPVFGVAVGYYFGKNS